MNEFKILLIDDDNEQEEQLKEAVINLNKKHFINGALNILDTDKKTNAELKLLDSKEEVYNQLISMVTDEDSIDKIKKLYDFNITYKTANNPDDAILLLYKEHFHALIVDLMLETDDSNKDNENYSGNVLLKNIIEKEIIPITVRTGFPDKITQEHNNNNLIEKCSKEHPTLEEVIENLIKSYENSIFSMFGSRGKVDENIKEFFWDILPKCFINKQQEIADLDKEIQEKVIIRYVSSWLNNKYMFDERYLDVEPIEMYLFPNPIDKVCSCDIYKDEDSNENFIVLTPSCDLANDKAENILFAKIQSYEFIDEFSKIIQNCAEQQKTEENISKGNRKKIASWSRNSNEKSMRYHFLPKVGFFDGGFIDFSLLTSLKYDREKNEFAERNLVKIGTITDIFKRDIIARFSSYYHRQGQPTFNTDSLLKKYL